MQTVVRVGGKSELPFNRVLSQQPVCVVVVVVAVAVAVIIITTTIFLVLSS